MHAHQVVLQDVRGDAIVELQDANRLRLSKDFLVLDRADCQVFNCLDLHKVVNLLIEGIIFSQMHPDKRLLGQRENLVP